MTKPNPGTQTFSISTVVTQSQHVDGLPLGTRGGTLVRYDFPADGEYVFYGRLLRTVAEGYVGVEGHETAVSIRRDHRWRAGLFRTGRRQGRSRSSSKNIVISREEVDKRMTSPRIKVTAGPHEVGFTFIERPTQEQNMWQPVLRDSLEAHNPSGIPRLRTGKHRRSVQRHRHQRNPGTQAAVHLQADVRRKGSGLRCRDPVRCCAPRLPTAGH